MYIVKITTPKGIFEEKINNMTEIEDILKLYPDYLSIDSLYQQGTIERKENQKKVKYNTSLILSLSLFCFCDG